MTSLQDRPYTALLVVDVQRDVVAAAHERDAVVASISSLVDRARGAGTPVGWVQHEDGELARGTEGWEYVEALARQEGEPLVHKRFGDSFEDTDLEPILAERQIGHLVVAGAQTD